MKSLYLDDTGDIELDGLNKLKMIDGLEEVKQRNRLSLGTRKGEWFLNKLFGIPWIKMLSENELPESFQKEILKVLNNDPAIDGVEKIELDFDRQDRKLEIKFVAIANGERFNERVVI